MACSMLSIFSNNSDILKATAPKDIVIIMVADVVVAHSMYSLRVLAALKKYNRNDAIDMADVKNAIDTFIFNEIGCIDCS